MSKGLEALNSLFETMPFAFLESNTMKELRIIEKELKALKIIVKKANIRLFEMNGRYYFKTTNNLYEISKEKYDLLKEVLNA